MMKIWHKVKDCEEDKPHKSEINKTDQSAKQPSSEGYFLHLVGTLFMYEIGLLRHMPVKCVPSPASPS